MTRRKEFDPHDGEHRERDNAERDHLEYDPLLARLRQRASDHQREPVRDEKRQRR